MWSSERLHCQQPTPTANNWKNAMITGTYVNLPVKNVAATRSFFAGLGFSFNEDFSNDKAVAMILGPNTSAMLLGEEFFKTFIPKPISDAHKSTEVLVAIQLADRVAVDAMSDKALETGGHFVRDAQDHGFMYSRAFADLDGHIWEPFWMTSEKQ
jgi:uncharacterized protein